MRSRQTRLRFASDVVLQTIGGEAVLLKLGEEAVFSLNTTGTRIAELVGAGLPAGAIADELSREYGVDVVETAAAVDELIGALEKRGLVVLEQEPVRDDG